MNYSLILACDKNGVIAVDDQIPWMGLKKADGSPKYINDLHNFRAITSNHIVIMGSKTFESMPGRKLLPNRLNVVLSSREEIRTEVKNAGGLAYDSVSGMHKALQRLKKEELTRSSKSDVSLSLPQLLKDEIFVIGGAEVYSSMKHLISKHYITVIPEVSASSSTGIVKYYNDRHYLESGIFRKPFVNNMEMDDMQFHIIDVGRSDISRPDNQFIALMNKILCSDNYVDAEKDRTQFGYFAVYGEKLKFDISDGQIPLTTLRAQPFRWIVEELLWFLNGYTDNKILKDKNISIWNGNTSAEFLKKRKLEQPEDVAGPIYGFQWRHWGAAYNTNDPDGYRLTDEKSSMVGGIDQFTEIIKNLSNPATRYGRRHIISGWNVSDLNAMALPPCHVLYQFSVDSKDQIHTTFYQRSSDVALACSWNATSAAIMTNIIGRLTGLQPATLIMFIANAHIYSNHVEGVKTMLTRKPYEFPTLDIVGVDKISSTINTQTVNNILKGLKSEQFKLGGYFAHPDISLSMNV